MKRFSLYLAIIIGLLTHQVTYAEYNPRFIKLFNYEVQNRIYALHSVSKIEKASSQTPTAAFWTAYKNLEIYNQEVYQSIAKRYEIDTDTSCLTHIKIHGSSLLGRLFPQSAQASIRDATIAYVRKLEELESLAPKQHQNFFQYVVEQEKAQAQGLTLLTAGKTDEATAVLTDFLKNLQKI